MSSAPTEDELQRMSLSELKKFARDNFGTTGGNSTPNTLIDFILEQFQPYTEEELKGYSEKELREIAKDLGVKNPARISRIELIDLILDAQAPDQEENFTEAELKRMRVTDLEALAEERFGTTGGKKNKAALIQFILVQQDKSDQFRDLRSYLAGEDLPLPEDGIGGVLRLLRENLDLADPVNPESVVQLAETLPPYQMLEISSEVEPLRRGGAVVVTSLNADQVRTPKIQTRRAIQEPAPPTSLERKRAQTSGPSDEIAETLAEIDFDKLRESVRHARGKNLYKFDQIKDFARRLGISLTNKNKGPLIQEILDLRDQVESS